MDRTRASSLECNKMPNDKYEVHQASMNQSNLGRNRIQSLISNSRDISDDSVPSDYYLAQDSKRSKSVLKNQLDLLQCTVNKMLNIGAFEDISSTCPSVNISEALKHEYRQMMSALKELENILSLKRKNADNVAFSGASSTNDTQVQQLQREIYYRDSLIKCLSDRLKFLCKANDKLIIDYENQESLLSEELLCLKRQLEKAKDAMRALAIIKKRPSISSSQDTDSELYYLRESMCTKEMMISDLKHRVDRLSRENADLKCELENKEESISMCVSSQYDRDMAYLKHSNDKMNEQIDTLTNSLNLKNRLIDDLQRQLQCSDESDLVRNLRDELMALSDENELRKEENLEQSDILEDFRNQMKILSENNQFKDETIAELKCCLRKLTESISGVSVHEERASQSIENKSNNLNALLNFVKRHINQKYPNLLRLLVPESDPYHALEQFILELIDMVGKSLNHGNDIELFKEFLTNEINLKNRIGRFLSDNTTGNIESIEKLQNQMNSLLSMDMDDGFKNDLKEYLHQCYLLDDDLRLVIEYMVKSINNIPVKSTKNFSEINSKYDTYLPTSVHTNDRSTFIPVGEIKQDNSEEKLRVIEEELRVMSKNWHDDKDRFTKELSEKEKELTKCQRNFGDLELENEKLTTENQGLISKLKQMERDLNMRTNELDNLEQSMRKLSSRFSNLSSTNDNVKNTMESIKDAEIEKLSKELDSLRDSKKNLYELERLYNEEVQRISHMTKELELMKEVQLHNLDLQRLINMMKIELQEKNDLLKSLSQIQDEKNKEIKELIDKLAEEKRASISMKSLQNQTNEHLTLDISNLRDENQGLSDKLTVCLDERSKLELKLQEMRSSISVQENSKSIQLQSSITNLKLENKSLEMKSNSLTSDKMMLEDQVRQLRGQLDDLTNTCTEHHVDKSLVRHDSDQQKIIDLESILALMTDELNEKAGSLEEMRKMIQKPPSVDLDEKPKCSDLDQLAINQQLLAQKESEIAYLKSRLDSCELRKSSSMSGSLNKNEISKLHQTILELETRMGQLNQQLTDRSNNIANLQQILKEKDGIIENASKMMKTKNDSLMETEKLMHLVSLQNTNIKDELSASYDGLNELNMLKSANKNLKEEIQRLKADVDRLKEALRNSINSDKSWKFKSQSFDLLPQKPPTVLRDNPVEQINEEIKKLYVNFEDKNKELKDYSLKEIGSRDKKLETINLELKLKADQMQTILIENKRLSDKIENESQRSTRFEQNLLLKEQLLEKLLREKEKVRATFITELRDKNEELADKSKTVYFLNAELHRLSSDLEILNAELFAVKSTEKFRVTQKHSIEIVQAELNTVKEENTSLKFCVNLKMAETEVMRNELKIHQASNQKLTSDHRQLKSEAQNTIDNLNMQLTQIKRDYDQINDMKMKLERAVDDLKNDNVSLKRVKEELENEKFNYRDEIEKLRAKIDLLTKDLLESKEKLSEFSGKIEHEKQKGRRLSEVMEISEQTKMVKTDELNQALRHMDELTNENTTFKKELDRLRHVVGELEDRDREGEIKTRALLVEHEGMMKELEMFDNLKKQLDECIKRKSMDCEELRKEREDMLQMIDKYQREIDNIKNNGQIKYQNLNENFDGVSQQLAIVTERYDRLRHDFEKLENDYCQQQHLYDTMTQNHNILVANADNQCQELLSLSDKNQQLLDDCSRLEQDNAEIKRLQCDNYSLQNSNEQMSSQIQSLTMELVAAHADIWQATSKINENQSTISHLCSRLNDKLASDRRYGSQPLLHGADPCNSDCGDMEQRDYNDLKTRYNALCSQIDNMVCQLKKKDKRVFELENELSTFNMVNYEQMKGDFYDLEKRYQQLEMELNKQYRSHSREHLHIQSHEVQVIQACAGELQDTIDTQNQELDQLKSTHQLLANDYNTCCERLRHLEKQIVMANAELGNWEKTYYHRSESFEADVNELRNENLNLLSAIEERNQLKQELVDLGSRMTDLMNGNVNLEQQSASYRQKIANQCETIEELKAQVHNVESFYEREVEQCRRDISVLKGNDRSFSADFNKEMKATKEELFELHNQYNLQCERYDQLKEDFEQRTMGKDELEQLYNDQAQNVEQLSAQLFNSRDIIEQLTVENNRLVNVVEESTCKINQLLEKIQKSEDCLSQRNNEIDEGKRNIVILENNLAAMETDKMHLFNQVEEVTEHLEHSSDDHREVNNRLKKELNTCYEMIDRLQHVRSQLIEDREKMSIVMQGLPEKSDENEKERTSETSQRRPVSIKELHNLKEANIKLSLEPSRIQPLSPSPVSDYILSEGHPIYPDKDEYDKSAVSDVTYSSSKSVTWKTKHTDQREGEDGGVLALEKAIDEYNSLVTDISVSNKPEVSMPVKSSTKRSLGKPSKSLLDKGNSVKSETVDVIFVEVESDIPVKESHRENISLDIEHNVSVESIDKATSVHGVESPTVAEVIQLLKNSDINLEYDDTKESFNGYFLRVMDRYKELEQFFLASMKIQFRQPLNEDTVELFENFNKNLENNRGILNEHCRQLNKMLVFATSDLDNEVVEASAQPLTSEQLTNLVELVRGQQIQMSALNVVFGNLQQISPIDTNNPLNPKISRLTTPYELLWQESNICSPDLRLDVTTVSQIPISVEKASLNDLTHQTLVSSLADVEDDSYLQNIASKHTGSDIVQSPQAISSPGSPRASPAQSLTLQASVSRGRGVVEDSVVSISNVDLAQNAVKVGRLKGKPTTEERSKSISATLQLSESRLKNVQENIVQNIDAKGPSPTSVTPISMADKSMASFSRPKSSESQTAELNVGNQDHEMIVAGKHSRENSEKPTSSQQEATGKEQNRYISLNMFSAESRERGVLDAANKIPYKERQESSLNLVHIADGGASNPGEVAIGLNLSLETVEYERVDGAAELDPRVVDLSKEKRESFDSVTESVMVTVSTDSIKINVAMERDINETHNVVESGPRAISEHKSISVLIKESPGPNKTRPTYLQNVSQGLSISEGKTKNMEKLEDNLSYASIGHFEKAMHQLNDIDFDNLDPKIDTKSRMRIYAAEIDYLNEKNLFHTYAIDVLTDRSRNLYNDKFLDHVNKSLVTKAKHLNLLQKEFKFDPHISTKEKTLIYKVLTSSYTFKGMFEGWMDLQKEFQVVAPSTNELGELQAELEKCMSAKTKDAILNEQMIKDIRSEKESLETQLQQMGKHVEEIESARRHSSVQRPEARTSNPSVTKQSKIPLLKGSSIEGPSVHNRVSFDVQPSRHSLPTQNRTESTSKQSRSSEPFVTPGEVKLAIAGETSIDNLRHFANLLAEDNFDLANEIEKLLTTIEELRRQLKENCEILSETVEMLQNSENFINDLEKRLAIETKKTQVISSRVDKLNELNKQVIAELQRILKENAPPSNLDMDVQERCDYLLECLKKIESENHQLQSAKVELARQVEQMKSSGAFSFLGPELVDGVNFDFESTLLPDGSMLGAISFVHSTDPSKTLALTFDMQSSRDNRLSSVPINEPNVAHFSIERESVVSLPNRGSLRVPGQRNPPPEPHNDNNNINNNNNNCGCDKRSSASNLSARSPSYCTHRPVTSRMGCVSLTTGSDDDLQRPTHRVHSLIHLAELADSSTELFTSRQKWTSMCSLSSRGGRKNIFINYRTPIYFRKVRDSH